MLATIEQGGKSLNELMNYIQKMIIYTIFMSIVLQIIPKKQYEKYIKFYMGILLLLLLFIPMFELLGTDKKMKQLYQSYENQWVNNENIEENKKIIYKQYEESIGEELKEVLEKKGYKIQKVKAEVKQENYGELEQVTVILKGENGTTIEAVAPIEIGKKEEQSKPMIKEDQELKELVQTICQQEEMNVIIQSDKRE